ncbi:MAG: hypothetical protein JXX29_15245 [Deltaproteobacteria bacterium]|nr:hypothetical protein [Deltaproteobacteria bacterium]MBN2673037.1 hypothetical protein [Deltaproteobacteria bacterium]
MLFQGAEKWLGGIVIAVIFSVCAPVRAQDVTGKGVGTIGGIVAGAEVVVVVESIIRVKPLWPYLVFPAVGAVGGGIGGYKLEQKSRGGAIALLITSMVGIIPTVIGASSARAFHPDDVGAKRGDRAIPVQSLEIQQHGDTGTTTEIESRPDGLPEGPLGPPAPDTTDDSEKVIDSEIPAQSRISFPAERAERLAHLSSGALFHVNRSLRFGLGIPAVDVVPLSLPPVHFAYRGMEVNVPLLVVDLP